MGNEVVLAGNHSPVPLDQMERMAIAIAKSGLFGLRTPEQALALMLIAQAEGRHPALAARDYDIIQGKPAKKAEAMLRDFLASGGKVTWHKLDDTQADATFSHPAGGEVRITWDMKRAIGAGLAGKDNWKKHPRQMLRSRTVSEGVRTVYPGATSGMYPPEEVQDFIDDKKSPEMKDVSAPTSAPGSVTTPSPSEMDPKTHASKPAPVAEIGHSSRPTTKQLNRLFAIKNENGWSDEALKLLMKSRYEKDSTKDLTWPEYDDICKTLLENKLNVPPSEIIGERFPFEEPAP